MKRRVRSWESMEREYGLDQWGGINNGVGFSINMQYSCGKIEGRFRKGGYAWEDWMFEPVFEKKSIEDFPLVEVSDDEKDWEKLRYLNTSEDGFHFVFIDQWTIGWRKHIRQIKPVNIKAMKSNAYLGVK